LLLRSWTRGGAAFAAVSTISAISTVSSFSAVSAFSTVPAISGERSVPAAMPAGDSIAPALLLVEQRSSIFLEQQLTGAIFEFEQRPCIELEQRAGLQQFERWPIEQQRAQLQQLEQLVIELQQFVKLQQ
jgi:hypothetical protein